MSPQELASISSPSRFESLFGTFEFFDGLPLPDTVDLGYDTFDLLRAIEVFLDCVPGASMLADAERASPCRHRCLTQVDLHRPEGGLGAADADGEHDHELRDRLLDLGP